MNVIVSNKQKEIIDNANIDAIKDLTGLFNVDDLIAKFKNYFFSKMILDVTSVENFTSREVLQKLVDGIGSDRLIILLPETPPPPDEFKKMLIDLKIYNFSNHIEDVVKFIDNPNTYESVLRDMGDSAYSDSGYVDNSIKGGSNNNDNRADDIHGFNSSFESSATLQDALDSFNIRESGSPLNNDLNGEMVSNQFVPVTDDNQYSNDNLANSMNSSGYSSNDNNEVNTDSFAMPSLNDLLGSSDLPVSENGNSFDTDVNNSFGNLNPVKDSNSSEMNLNGVNIDSNSNMYNTMNNSQVEDNGNYFNSNVNSNSSQTGNIFLNISGLSNMSTNSKQIIGFKNVTNHAGSTTLIYMLLKALTDMKIDAIAIEINSDDFKLFMNNRMVSIQENDIKEYLASRYEKVILVDLNDCNDTSFCNDIIYLVEPSTIMLNKLMVANQNIFRELSGKKVVLNKSMLLPKDVSILANEAGINFAYNLRTLNDRINNDDIVKFINVLGIR